MHPSLSARDRLLCLADDALRMLAGGTGGREAQRDGRPCPTPAAEALHQEPDGAARRHAAALMRINHAGEIAAQGLYHGQSLTAVDPAVREHLRAAAREEGDHLAWCRERLNALHDRPSLLDPLWYTGAVAMGVLAGLVNDRVSLGFVVETEKQVEAHLTGHLETLPLDDAADRAVVEQMRADEVAHGAAAQACGAAALPAPVRAAMRTASKIMTTVAYHV